MVVVPPGCAPSPTTRSPSCPAERTERASYPGSPATGVDDGDPPSPEHPSRHQRPDRTPPAAARSSLPACLVRTRHERGRPLTITDETTTDGPDAAADEPTAAPLVPTAPVTEDSPTFAELGWTT